MSKQAFLATYALEPKRIHFRTIHRSALKRSAQPYVGTFTIPFLESIDPLFPLQLFPSKSEYGGYYRSIRDEAEFQRIEQWVSGYYDIVFIRSCLRACYALSLNMNDPGVRTPIGQQEYLAKFHSDPSAVESLAQQCAAFLNATLLQKFKVNSICGIPASDPARADSLVSRIAGRVAGIVKVQDVSSAVAWKSPKPPMKSVTFSECLTRN